MPTDRTNQISAGADWNLLRGASLQKILKQLKAQKPLAGTNITTEETKDGVIINYLASSGCPPTTGPIRVTFNGVQFCPGCHTGYDGFGSEPTQLFTFPPINDTFELPFVSDFENFTGWLRIFPNALTVADSAGSPCDTIGPTNWVIAFQCYPPGVYTPAGYAQITVGNYVIFTAQTSTPWARGSMIPNSSTSCASGDGGFGGYAILDW